MNKNFWKNKNILITGHTGFKGSWLTLILNFFGSKVYGYSLENNEKNSIFNILNISQKCHLHQIGDIRDYKTLEEFIFKIKPDVIFHLAAQPILIQSYLNPIETFATNVLGTVHILNCAKKVKSIQSIVNVTTDKCYELKEEDKVLFNEKDLIGGNDPYSSSKSCSELVTSAYKVSFLEDRNVGISTARAGNIVGGGDWGEYRLIPDILRSILKKEKLMVRYPEATRPWQHVLEPLSGYMKLAECSFG